MLSANLERFLKSAIRSVWDLELLLFLHRAPSSIFTADALVRALRGSSAVVADALLALAKLGLVAAENGGYRYWPITPELDRLVAELATAYASYPSAVMNTIWSTPHSKIQIFADAFRIKKDKD